MEDIILPYDKELINSNGAFIKPNGEIVRLQIHHEWDAGEYCH